MQLVKLVGHFFKYCRTLLSTVLQNHS